MSPAARRALAAVAEKSKNHAFCFSRDRRDRESDRSQYNNKAKTTLFAFLVVLVTGRPMYHI
jgi:hypothetical protein